MTLDPAVLATAKGATHLLLYLGALGIIGAGVCRALVLPHAGPAGAVADGPAAQLARVAAWALFAAVVLRLYVQVLDSYLTLVPTADMLTMLLLHTRTWGHGIAAQLVLGAALVGVTTLAARRHRHARAVALVAALVAGAAVPLTGHAAAHGGPVGVTAQALHVLAIGAWIGTLAVLLRVGASLPLPAFAASIVAFSRVARVAAPTVAVAGIGALLSHVGTEGLIGSPYGGVLAGKVALFAAVGVLGAVNWRRHTPALDREDGRTLLMTTARLEVGLAAVALLLTPVLTAIGRPGD